MSGFSSGFTNVVADLEGEQVARAQDSLGTLTFGVSYLDDALDGIAKNDVIMLTGRSGGGKTELAMNIAKANAEAGKRVHFIALEAEPKEITRRLKYKICADAYFEMPRCDQRLAHVSYRLWRNNELVFPPGIEEYAEEMIAAKYGTLELFYRRGEFAIDDLSRAVGEIHEKTDLIIVDHLHYFDVPDDKNENKEFSNIIKRIRSLALDIGKPFLLLCHLKKRDRMDKSLIPDLEDIQGTSNLYKVATKTIAIARDNSSDDISTTVFRTFMAAGKYRRDQSASFYVASVPFDVRRNAYEREYLIGTLKKDRSEFVARLDPKIQPHWAKNAKKVIE